MKNNDFAKLVRDNRKLLAKGGVPQNLLTMYASGLRTPSYETAVKISAILGLSVMSLPWSKREINRP